VDASEAWKHPDKKDYFFGAHDDNRLQFTVGRDIRLDPSQQGDPLNYFIYPYAELDGKPFAVESKFSFQDRINGGDRGSFRRCLPCLGGRLHLKGAPLT